MQLYTALLICILVLSLTGGLKPFNAIFRLGRFQAAFFALCLLALSRFYFSPSPEMRFNLCALAMPLLLILWAREEGARAGAPAALVVFSLLAFGAEKAGVFSGTGNGLLMGFIAGAAAAVLADTPRTALAVAVTVPVVCALLASCYALLMGNYAVLDFSQAALRDAQLSGLCFGSVLLCLHAVATAGERTES